MNPPMTTIKPGSKAHRDQQERDQLTAQRLRALALSLFRPQAEATPPKEGARPSPKGARQAAGTLATIGEGRPPAERIRLWSQVLVREALKRQRRYRGKLRLIMQASTIETGGTISGREDPDDDDDAALLPEAVKAFHRAERLLLRLVQAHATRTDDGEQVVIGKNRRRQRKPHCKKKTLRD